MSSASTDAPLIAVSTKTPVPQAIVWVLFLFSGICGLIYEVLWCRHLGLLFGNTVQSMSAVLTAFMAGLALGSYVGGRLSHRLKRPMMAYGVLELSIGIYCAFLPWLLGQSSPILPLYRSLYGELGGGLGLSVARFGISFLLLLIPTTFMGATLPVLAQFLVRSKVFLGKTVGTLYAVNTFGAVLGAAMTGFFLLPALGKASTNNIAVVANLILGTLAVIFGMGQSARVQAEEPAEGAPGGEGVPDGATPEGGGEPQAPVSPLALKLAIFTFGITGFAALATQIGWTRAISLATGSSTYAFSLIVSVFILGLSLGGVWGARMAARTRDPLALLGKVLIAIGLSGMALTAILGFGPQMFFVLLVWGSDRGFNWQLAFQALGIALLIIGPTFLMGATMPLTMQVAARSSESAGRTVGTIYAVNTVGSILGSFFGGLVLLPLLQIQGTLKLMSVLYVAPGVVLYLLSRAGRNKKPISEFVLVLLGALVTLGMVFASRWDPMVMSSGMYLLRSQATLDAVRSGNWGAMFENVHDHNDLLYYSEGAAATVAVNRITDQHDASKKVISLSVGGKPDATSHGDMSTQLGLTLVPELIHGSGPESVLVVGLGSGASVAAALAPSSVKQVDVVEMSPEVVEASYFFAPYTGLHYVPQPGNPNAFWLEEPRLNLIVNDGRNHLLLTAKKYDVIASEPSNPWLAGVGNLFTREAFQLSREHLNKNGVMCQWIHGYSLEEDDFFNIVKTFGEVFPHIQLWCVHHYDYLLIGSDGPLQMPIEKLRGRLAQERVLPLLKSIDFDSEEEFLACFMSTDAELRAIAAGKRYAIHTDDNMLLEFSAPRALYKQENPLQSTHFESDPEDIASLAALTPEGPGGRAETERRIDFSAAGRLQARCAFEGAGDRLDHWFAASLLAPKQHWVLEDKQRFDLAAMQQMPRLARGALDEMLRKADDLADQGQLKQAMELLQKSSEAAAARGENTYALVEKAARILRGHGQDADADATLKLIWNKPGARFDPKSAGLWALWAELQLEKEKPNPEATMALAQQAKNLASAAEDEQMQERKRRQKAGLPPVPVEPSGESNALGSVARILLKEKKFQEAFNEYRYLTETHALNIEYKLGLADALMGLAGDPEVLNSRPEMALKKLHHARRESREAFKLKFDEAGAAVRLAAAQMRLLRLDAAAAPFHRAEARAAWGQAETLDKYGLLKTLEAMQQGDFNKPERRAAWIKIEEFFKTDPLDLKELAREIAK